MLRIFDVCNVPTWNIYILIWYILKRFMIYDSSLELLFYDESHKVAILV